MSGLMSVTGLAGQGPVRAGAAIADVSTGMVLVQGILTALYQRARTGEGQWVHTSLLESLVSVMDFQVARWMRTGDVPGQAGNDHPTLMPTGLFPAADGEINLAAAEDPKFAALCNVLGLGTLLADPDYGSVEARSTHRQKLCAILAEKTRTLSRAELIDKLNAAGIPCGPVYAIDEAMEDVQMKSLGMNIPVDHPRLGQMDVLGQPLSLEGSGGRPVARSHAPDLGEHTDDILANLLGYEKAAIATMRSRGVI
jgi:crotonobetainyl-CoA:carnitine CoA-transferase CaiB-like acyl-CoA transferase